MPPDSIHLTTSQRAMIADRFEHLDQGKPSGMMRIRISCAAASCPQNSQ